MKKRPIKKEAKKEGKKRARVTRSTSQGNVKKQERSQKKKPGRIPSYDRSALYDKPSPVQKKVHKENDDVLIEHDRSAWFPELENNIKESEWRPESRFSIEAGSSLDPRRPDRHTARTNATMENLMFDYHANNESDTSDHTPAVMSPTRKRWAGILYI